MQFGTSLPWGDNWPQIQELLVKGQAVILEYVCSEFDWRTAKFMSPELVCDVLEDLSNHS